MHSQLKRNPGLSKLWGNAPISMSDEPLDLPIFAYHDTQFRLRGYSETRGVRVLCFQKVKLVFKNKNSILAQFYKAVIGKIDNA